MSDQAQTNNQQVVVYALIAIAVLLAAIVGFMIYNNMASKGATASSGAASTTADSAAGIANQMPTAAAPVPFDPKTATKLPAGMDPATAMKTYSDAIKAANWKVAFDLLPTGGKKTYGTPDAMGAQLKSYGITGFRVGPATTSGSDTSVVIEEDTPAMNITYTWTFTKSGSDWLVKNRTMGGAVK
jgi:hypothetical protein